MRRIVALFAFLQGCVVAYPSDPYAPNPPPAQPRPPPPAYHPPPPPSYPPPPAYPAPPPAAPRELTRDEVVGRAYQIAGQHGLQASGVEEMEREHGRWKVELRLAGGGKAKVQIDAWSGAELRFKAEGHHRRHEDHDEDD